jgi:hypothetical protein
MNDFFLNLDSKTADDFLDVDIRDIGGQGGGVIGQVHFFDLLVVQMDGSILTFFQAFKSFQSVL